MLINDSLSIEHVADTLRRLWQSIEDSSEEIERTKLKRDIIQTVNRLKGRVDKRLKSPKSAAQERLLFDHGEEGNGRVHVPEQEPQIQPRFRDATARIYDKDLADLALSQIPLAIKYKTIREFSDYLNAKLPFNSQATRQRNANRIIGRFFPGDRLHRDLVEFAAAMKDKPALADALFYMTCRMEPIVALVADEVVFPSLPEGGVTRGRVREFVQSQFPGSKSVPDMSQAIVRTYERFELGSTTKTRLNVYLREGSLAAFGYLLHLEFPEPGMHAFERMFDGPMHRWLLWDQQWMIGQLYCLREAGIVSKVSEIDRMRQFTTKYTLADAVRQLRELKPRRCLHEAVRPRDQLAASAEAGNADGTAPVRRPGHLRAPGAIRAGGFSRGTRPVETDR